MLGNWQPGTHPRDVVDVRVVVADDEEHGKVRDLVHGPREDLDWPHGVPTTP